MKLFRTSVFAAAGLLLAVAVPAASLAQDDADPALVELVIGLLADQDPDMRALGFEQIRTGAPGAAATRRFADEMSGLSLEARQGLLSALADRADPAARPAVLALLDADETTAVRTAAIAALARLGRSEDVDRLVDLLESDASDERAAARDSLVRLGGEATPAALGEALRHASPAGQATLINVLADRREFDLVPAIVEAAVAEEEGVRAAAMDALGELAGPDDLPGLVRGVLRAAPGAERAAAEKAVMFVCRRIENPADRAAPLLQAIDSLSDDDRLATLSTLGRVGGPAARAVVEAAIADPSASRHDAGVRALCNWPTASIAARLKELAIDDDHADHRLMALRALLRVAPLPDERSDAERLALLQEAAPFCTRDRERILLLDRAKAVRTVETLRYALTFLDEPNLSEQACLTVVELAHHRGLRDANKAEFHAALDRVIETSRDEVVIERARRYQNGQTWVRPRA